MLEGRFKPFETISVILQKMLDGRFKHFATISTVFRRLPNISEDF